MSILSLAWWRAKHISKAAEGLKSSVQAVKLSRGVTYGNSKAGKAAGLPKFLDTMLTLSQSGERGQIMHNHWLCLT